MLLDEEDKLIGILDTQNNVSNMLNFFETKSNLRYKTWKDLYKEFTDVNLYSKIFIEDAIKRLEGTR